METVIDGGNVLIGSLHELITLNDDAIEALSEAIARIGDRTDRGRLERFLEDHRRYVLELEALVRDLGEEPPGPSSGCGRLAKCPRVVNGLIGDRAVLSAIKINEEDACAAYERVLSREDLPERVRRTIERGLADEQRHHDWLAEELDAAGGLMLLLL